MERERTIGRFRLLERIAGSSWGEVYRARDTERGQTVALKLMAAGTLDEAARHAFLEDAREAAILSHPNIAILYGSGEEDGCCYLAYEFAAGATLAQEVDGRPMNQRRAVDIAGQLADALADAHARGIIHGDMRPGTVIVTVKGNAKVLDFGMAKWMRSSWIRSRAVTHPEDVEADAQHVIAYMSPEQAIGSPVDGRTDLFSLGVILYEMLTGRNPFAATTVADTILKVVGSNVPAPSTVNPDITPEVDALVLKALSKDLEHRPQGAAAFAASLRSAGAAVDLRSAESRSPADPAFGDDDEHRTVWWAVALLGVLLGAAAVWWLAR